MGETIRRGGRGEDNYHGQVIWGSHYTKYRLGGQPPESILNLHTFFISTNNYVYTLAPYCTHD